MTIETTPVIACIASELDIDSPKIADNTHLLVWTWCPIRSNSLGMPLRRLTSSVDTFLPLWSHGHRRQLDASRVAVPRRFTFAERLLVLLSCDDFSFLLVSDLRALTHNEDLLKEIPPTQLAGLSPRGQT